MPPLLEKWRALPLLLLPLCIIIVCDMMLLTLSEFKCKRQQGLSPGQELRKILPYDDCFEHPLHSVHGSADHWPCGGLLPWFLFLLL